MTDRFPPLPEEGLSDAQRKVAREIAAGPRGGVRGPFIPLLRSPDLAAAVQKVGEYLRFAGGLPKHLLELAILLTAHKHASAYEWQAHAILAAQAGLPQAIVDALGRGERPAAMAPDAAEVHDFVRMLLDKGAVDEPTFAGVKARFGDQGTIDLVATCGYYTMLAMVLNVAQTPLPQGRSAPFAPAFAAV